MTRKHSTANVIKAAIKLILLIILFVYGNMASLNRQIVSLWEEGEDSRKNRKNPVI